MFRAGGSFRVIAFGLFFKRFQRHNDDVRIACFSRGDPRQRTLIRRESRPLKLSARKGGLLIAEGAEQGHAAACTE